MPVIKLKKEAKKAGLKPGSKRFNAYVYGTEARIKRLRMLKRKRK
jgi:hypothetical protein